MTEDASVIKVSSRVFSRTRLEVGEGGPRDKPVALHFFDNTLNLFMTSGVALNVPLGCIEEKLEGGGEEEESSSRPLAEFLLDNFSPLVPF